MAPVRRSFTKEFKLEVIRWHYDNDNNVNQTSNEFKVDRKQVRQWVKSEESIRGQKRLSKSELTLLEISGNERNGKNSEKVVV